MDAQPREGRGRGRGKEKSPAPAPLEQLTLEEKVKDQGESLKSSNESVDDKTAAKVKSGSPRGRGIGRGRGEAKGPLALVEEDNDTRIPPVCQDNFQDKEAVPEPSKKTNAISDQVSPVSEVQQAVTLESNHEDDQAPMESDVQTVATRDIQTQSEVPRAVTQETQTPMESEVKKNVSRESQEDDQGKKLAPTSAVDGVKSCLEEKAVSGSKEKAEGIDGEPLQIKTSYFMVKLRPGHTGVVEYHISTKPVVEHFNTLRCIMNTQQACDFLGTGTVQILDGKVLYLFTILPGSDVVYFESNFEGTDYTVRLELMDIKEMNQSMAVINGLLAKSMRHLGYTKTVGRFYDPTMEKILCIHRLSIMPGIDLTAEYQNESFKVTVEFSRLIIQQDHVLKQLQKFRGDPQMRSKFEKLIIGKTVMTKYNLRYFKICNVMWDLKPVCKFHDKGIETSFKDQIKDEVTITEDDQPMLITQLKPCGNDACKECRGKRIAMLIPEVCYILGLTEAQDLKLNVLTDLMETTNEFFEKPETKPATFVNRVLANEEIRGFFLQCGLHLSSAEDATQHPDEAGQDV